MTIGARIQHASATLGPRARLLAFGVVALASVALGFLTFSVHQSQYLIEHYGYYTISFTFAWALIAAWRIAPVLGAELAAPARRERFQAGGVIAVCTVIAVLTVPITYKVLYDEMVLQATAWDMHFFREVKTILRGYRVDGMFVPFDAYLDKRPFFFAYLVSLVHDLTGYREANAFYVNLALMPVVLVQVYYLGRRLAAHGGALAAVVALGTLSLLAQNATGAGMEMLNLAMLLLTLQLGLIYLDAPDAPRLAAMLLAAVLLAQTRYESSLYVLPTAVVALEGWRRAGRIILPPSAIFAPALLIPYAIHNTYLSGTPLLWELHQDEKARFGLDHFWSNLHHAGLYLFSGSTLSTNSFWLSVAGILAFLFGLYRLWRGRRGWRTAPPVAVGLVAFGVVILGNLLLLMFYYWGQLDDPIVARLSLPTCVLLALALAYAVNVLDAPRRHLAAVSIGGAVLCYVWSGLIANAQHSALNTLDAELAWEQRYVASLPPGDRLILTNKSALPWMIHETPAIAIEQARHRVEELRFQLENHTFREILVTQMLRPTSAAGDYQLDPADRLPDWFVLQPVAEHRFGTRLDRVSRLVEIQPRPPAPPKK
ncbi:MAG TPA: glycosyltransferase family 39 protein [Opitutaceae bacterium]|nr:glycosyltransferase family 39 protein [Opitutaceae bacterium]